VALPFGGLPNNVGWTIQRAEDLLSSLKGVVSVRVVARPGGNIEEIHLLTTTDVAPKQTVRNVESALKAHFHLEVDHRIISVAQSTEAVKKEQPPAEDAPGPLLLEKQVEPVGPGRILFLGHQIETERARRVKVAVSVEWGGTEYTGEAIGTDLARSRQETVAKATLAAIEKAMEADAGEEDTRRQGVTLALDGVKTVEAFDRSYVLVGVNAIYKRDVAELSGASAVEDTPERAVILATLQATDRWVRGRF
jgi:hypothetical protein